MRAAGLPVTYARSGELHTLGRGVQLAVYRIVQEALTNTLKHAGPGAGADVTIAASDGEVRVRVRDNGHGEPAAPSHGLLGMRERAANGAETVRAVEQTRPDVVLMDVRMPGMDGIEATRRITAAGSRTQVLIMTTFDLDEYVYAGLRAGASGFLLKDARPEELIAGIRAVAGGESVVAPSLTRKLMAAYLPDAAPAARTPRSPNGSR